MQHIALALPNRIDQLYHLATDEAMDLLALGM